MSLDLNRLGVLVLEDMQEGGSTLSEKKRRKERGGRLWDGEWKVVVRK